MNAPDLVAALRPVLSVLGDLGVRHFVGGSIASSAHGVARASLGVDYLGRWAAPLGVEDLLERILGRIEH